MKLLIDADYIVYKACAASEMEIDYSKDVIVVVSSFEDVMKSIHKELDRISELYSFYPCEVELYFSHYDNFRKKLCPTYKGQRNRKKPCGYVRAIKRLEFEGYNVIEMPDLEADDAMGIRATSLYEELKEYTIVSPDKDMRQIPGNHYNFGDAGEFTITADEGKKWHLIQTLAGDSTDGYSGAPGYGVISATKLFEKEGYSWKTVVDAFKSKGLTEEDALLNARLAKILTKDDYDSKSREFILWTPTPDYRIDSGAELQTETARDVVGAGK